MVSKERTLRVLLDPVLGVLAGRSLYPVAKYAVVSYSWVHDTWSDLVQAGAFEAPTPGEPRVADIGRAFGYDPGLSQEEQKALLASFSGGATRVLVATSVAEEGLHVPSVDMVVFYEPVVSEIRTIQRRGRTGRTRLGHVVVLATRHTRDDRAYWASGSKERSMRRIVSDLGSASATPGGAAADNAGQALKARREVRSAWGARVEGGPGSVYPDA